MPGSGFPLPGAPPQHIPKGFHAFLSSPPGIKNKKVPGSPEHPPVPHRDDVQDNRERMETEGDFTHTPKSKKHQ